VWVPWELQGQPSAQVKVTVDGNIFGNVVNVSLGDYQPQLLQASPGVAAARDQNFNLITANNPVARGQVVQLYANGLGPVSNTPASGDPALADPLSMTTTQPLVTIGGQQAQILFSGLAPGFAGLSQINALVPDGIAPGTQLVTVAIGGQTSQPLSIVVN
jgi:uncharacterized protein (TIGR03437 family)